MIFDIKVNHNTTQKKKLLFEKNEGAKWSILIPQEMKMLQEVSSRKGAKYSKHTKELIEN